MVVLRRSSTRMLVAVIGAVLLLAGCSRFAAVAPPRHNGSGTPSPPHRTSTSTSTGGCVVGAAGAARAGCPARMTTSSAPRRSATSISARALCRHAFPGRVLLAWASTTVNQMRAYQFGGPIAHRPLRHAFRTSAGARRGAWCMLRDRPVTASLWATLGPRDRQRTITISGPGAGDYLGPMRQPPRVP